MSKQMKRQAGFTLVELAVVMIIIGLLIGGVLKGQELIGNAQVTSTVSQIKGIDAATSTFRDMYNSLPGDMANATTRLANCVVADGCTLGNGNQRLETTPAAAPTGEAAAFFVHLSVADLITGIDPASTAGAAAWGVLYPSAPIRGAGFTVGSAASAAEVGGFNTNARAGLYTVVTDVPNAAPGVGAALNPNQAARIDAKLDDGVADAGGVRGGNGDGGTCATGGAYNESVPNESCFLSIRIQG